MSGQRIKERPLLYGTDDMAAGIEGGRGMAGSHALNPGTHAFLYRKVTLHVFYFSFKRKENLQFLLMPYSSTRLVSDISMGATYTGD